MSGPVGEECFAPVGKDVTAVFVGHLGGGEKLSLSVADVPARPGAEYGAQDGFEGSVRRLDVLLLVAHTLFVRAAHVVPQAECVGAGAVGENGAQDRWVGAVLQ